MRYMMYNLNDSYFLWLPLCDFRVNVPENAKKKVALD
jgi:hypothetical protein